MQQTVSFRPRSTKRLRLTDFKADAYQVFYTDGNGNIQEVPLGASNTVLTSNGPNVPPTFESTGVAGTLVGTASTGAGVAVVGNIVAGVAQFRSLIGDTGIGITDDGDSIHIALAPSLLPAFTGATAATNGLGGGVPAPLIAERSKYLRGDGAWADIATLPVTSAGAGASLIYSATSAGTVLRSLTAASNRIAITQNAQDVSIDVATANLPSFGGATASVSGTKGVVPLPPAGANTMFLRGDGTWAATAVTTVANVGTGAGVFKNYTTQQNLRSLVSLNSNLTILASTDTITFNLSSAVVTSPMTGATQVMDGAAGLVPKPFMANWNMFLRGDGSWAVPTISAAAENVGSGAAVFSGISGLNALQFRRIASTSAAIAVATSGDGNSIAISMDATLIPAFTGATSLGAGVKGMVPQPVTGDQAKYLCGDGTWKALTTSIASGAGSVAGDLPVYAGSISGVDTFRYLRGLGVVEVSLVDEAVIGINIPVFVGADDGNAGSGGTVPAPGAGSTRRFLCVDGTWAIPATMTGATAVVAGVSGLVPTPIAGDHVKFLRGDGVWIDISSLGETNTASNVGAGAGLYRSKTGANLDFKTLVAGAGIQVTPGVDTVTITNTAGAAIMTGASGILDGLFGLVPTPHAGDNAKVLYGDGVWRAPPGASGGEANTAANIGTGVPIYAQKSGIELDFRSILATGGVVTVTGSAQTVNIGFDPTQVAAMTGATSGVAGVKGFVPAPAIGDQVNFLRGDGTWQAVVTSTAWGAITGTLASQADLQTALNAKASSGHTHAAFTGASSGSAGAVGFVPAPSAGDQTKFLRADGIWATVVSGNVPFTGATVSTAGAVGAVPAPSAGDQDKFLRADGTWAAGGGSGGSGANSKISGLTGLTAFKAYRFGGAAWILAIADAPANAEVIGIADTSESLVTSGTVTFPAGTLVPGGDYWLDPVTPGAITTPEPVWTYGQVRVFIGTAIDSSTLQLNIDLGDVVLNAVEADVASKLFSRAVAAVTQYYAAAGVAQVINFDTVSIGAGQVTTGVNWRFTSTRNSRFVVSAASGLQINLTNTVTLGIYVNGALYAQTQMATPAGTSWGVISINDIVNLNNGDYVDIRITSPLTANLWSAMSRVSIAEL